MSKTLIFGHKNPDTDSICSALAYADLKATIDRVFGEQLTPVPHVAEALAKLSLPICVA